MALKNPLTAAQKRKARKTPVHGAAAKLNKRVSEAAGIFSKQTAPKNTVSLQEASAKNKEAFDADVAKAKAAGFRKINGRWVKPKKVVTSKGKGTAAVGPSGRSTSETKRKSNAPSKLTKKTKKRSKKVVKKARGRIGAQKNKAKQKISQGRVAPQAPKTRENKRKNAIL